MSGSRGLQALGSMDDAKALAREFKGQGDGGGTKRKNKNKKSKATISTAQHGNSHLSSIHNGMEKKPMDILLAVTDNRRSQCFQ